MRCRAWLPLAAVLGLSACTSFEIRHPIQWDARSQIWAAEASQVKVRAAQSEVFDTSDETRTLEAVVATFQDLGFRVDVLDEVLGIVAGRKYLDLDRPSVGTDPTYFLYREEGLVAFTRSYRSWGPFWKRCDLVRLTVTVRERNASQLIVRAAAQFYLRPVEDPEPYREFFRTLRQALFVDRELSAPPASAPAAP